MNVGANVNLSNTRITVGTGSVNTFITATAIETDGTLTVADAATLSNTLAVTNTTTLSNTLTVAGLASLNAALNTTTANASVAVNVGANVNLTLDRFNVGNNSVNTFITATAIETDGTLTVFGATALSNTLGVTGLTTLSGNLNTTTANASVGINVGANVNLSNTRITVGTSSENTFITATGIETDGTLSVANTTTLSNTLSVTGAATFSNTIGVTNTATFSNTITVTGAASFGNTIAVTNSATLSNTLGVTGLSTLSGGMNTTTANASVAMNVGANVNLTLTRITVGTGSVNTFITSTAIETDGTLGVLGATTLSNTVTIGGTTTFKTDYVVDVSANGDIGNVIGPVLIYTFPKATYSSAKFEVQVKKGSNTQLSELVLAHNGTTDAYVTVYGTVASNGAASPLGTFVANTGSSDTNVNLYLQQTVANSAVKVIAHLIK
jgi:hypothetical protein